MDLLIVRHAPAEDRDAFAETGRPDAERPLTRDGERKMRRGARAIADLVPELALLATSPYTRARETAEILADAYGAAPPTPVSALVPDAPPEELLEWLRGVTTRDDAVIGVVGHEPHLSGLATWLLTGRTAPAVLELKKGAACLLAFDGEPRAGGARLRWSLAPSQLRGLAG